ncbi:MAG: hypothetical protein ACI92W_000642, partial [Paraglaciecola sp.]
TVEIHNAEDGSYHRRQHYDYIHQSQRSFG